MEWTVNRILFCLSQLLLMKQRMICYENDIKFCAHTWHGKIWDHRFLVENVRSLTLCFHHCQNKKPKKWAFFQYDAFIVVTTKHHQLKLRTQIRIESKEKRLPLAVSFFFSSSEGNNFYLSVRFWLKGE